MDDDDISLPHSPSASDLTTLSLLDISKTGSSNCASSGMLVGQRAELLMTRRHPITWTSTTYNDSDSSLRLKETSPPWTPTPHQLHSDDREEYASGSKSLSEGGNTGQGPTESPHATMTDSALIAYSYRMAQTRGCEGQTAISVEALVTIDSASCSDTRAAMRWVTAGIEDVFQDPDEKLSRRVQSSLQLHDMLCSVPPCIIDKTSNALTEEAQKERDAHAILYNHRRTPHAIVLDSRCPDLVPHIVITPPSHGWEEYWEAQENSIVPQNKANLFVHPFYLSTCRLPTYNEWMTMFYPPLVAEEPEVPEPQIPAPTPPFSYRLFKQYFEHTAIDRASSRAHAALFATSRLLLRSAAIAAGQEAVDFCTRYTPQFLQSVDNFLKCQTISAPRPVFNHSYFHTYVNHTYDERTAFMTHAAVFATHRLQLRLAFISTSIIATEWRTIYDDTTYLGSIDKHFKWKWTDPAEPLFLQLGPRPANVTIIDSEFPCSAPHIMIHFAESNDPWIVWENATGRQDCSYGNSLVVGSGINVRLEYVNVPGSEDEGFDDSSNSSDFDEQEGYLTDTSCSDSSPYPEAPREMQRLGSGFFSDADEEDITNCRYEKYSQYISGVHTGTAASIWNEPPSSYIKSEYPSRGIFYLPDEDEEEDGPPEYDEWYITRAGHTLDAEEAN